MDFDNESERQAIRELVASVYRAISGPAGAPRAWDQLPPCYVDEGRMTPFHVQPDGSLNVEVFTPATYAESRSVLLANQSFYETESGHEATIVGRIANVFSHYEARREPDQPPFATGVNSIQLLRGSDGWRILSMTWQFTGVKGVVR